MNKIYMLIIMLFLNCLNIAKADFTTGFAAGVLLSNSTNKNNQIKEKDFIDANQLRLQIEHEKIVEKNNLKTVFEEVKKEILKTAEEKKYQYCYYTGFFDTKENNWLELEKQEGNKYKYFFDYFRNLNYKITSLEKGGNGFCFNW